MLGRFRLHFPCSLVHHYTLYETPEEVYHGSSIPINPPTCTGKSEPLTSTSKRHEESLWVPRLLTVDTYTTVLLKISGVFGYKKGKYKYFTSRNCTTIFIQFSRLQSPRTKRAHDSEPLGHAETSGPTT